MQSNLIYESSLILQFINKINSYQKSQHFSCHSNISPVPKIHSTLTSPMLPSCSWIISFQRFPSCSQINPLQTSLSAFKSFSAFKSLPALSTTFSESPFLLSQQNLTFLWTCPIQFPNHSTLTLPSNFKSTFFKVHFPFSNHSTPSSLFLIPNISFQISLPILKSLPAYKLHLSHPQFQLSFPITNQHSLKSSFLFSKQHSSFPQISDFFHQINSNLPILHSISQSQSNPILQSLNSNFKS